MGALPYATIAAVCRKTRGRCYYCGFKQPSVVGPGEGLTIDHMTPRCLGGTDDMESLVPACRTCNSIKGKRTVDEARHNFTISQLGWPPFTREMIAWMAQMGHDIRPYFEHRLWFERSTKAGT